MNNIDMRVPRTIFGLLLACILAVSGAAVSSVARSEDPPPAAGGINAKEPDGDITLEQSLALALLRNPEMAAFSWEVRAAEARVLQAGLRGNPELEFEIEEFAGTGEKSGSESSVATLGFSLPLELGGKRLKRKRVAALEQRAAGWDYESKRLDVLAETTRAFINTLSAQERYALARESYQLSEKVVETVSERVKAGKVSPLEETRARVSLSTSRVEMERADRELRAARKRLASNWGSDTPTFKKAAGEYYRVDDVEKFEEMKAKVSANPDIARWDHAMELRGAIVEMEKAEGAPDMSVGLGNQWFNESGERAFVFHVAVTLPVNDRNQGGTLAAERERDKGAEERRAAETRILTELDEVWQELNAAHLEAVTLSKDVLPSAQWAFDAAQEGYRYGKFGYLDVLDAQRTLYEVKGQYIQALADYHASRAAADRLTGSRGGQSIDSSNTSDNGGGK